MRLRSIIYDFVILIISICNFNGIDFNNLKISFYLEHKNRIYNLKNVNSITFD